MATRESLLDRNLEKLLFAAAAGLLGVYLVLLLAGVEVPNLIAGDQWQTQTFDDRKRSADVSGAAEFADRDLSGYWDGSLPYRMVIPKQEKVFIAVELPVPTPTVSPPPVPLPRPGPAFEHSGSFERMRPGSRTGPVDADGTGDVAP